MFIKNVQRNYLTFKALSEESGHFKPLSLKDETLNTDLYLGALE